MLQISVDEDYDVRKSQVRERWDAIYTDTSIEVEDMREALLDLYNDDKATEARELMNTFVEATLMECYEVALEEVNGFKENEAPKPVDIDDGENKTLVYIGILGVVLVISSVLISYIMKVGKSH